MERPYLSVVIPAYNESRRIGVTLESLESYFRKASYEYEVLVVSDGSTDGTVEIVRTFAAAHPQFKLEVIDNAVNGGKGYAVKCGMERARGEYRLFMDADNSVTIDALEPFIEGIKGGADVVIGSIEIPTADAITDHNHGYRRFLGSLSKRLIRSVVVPGIYDTQRGFKLFTANAAETIFPHQSIMRFGFDIELLVIARVYGLVVKELPVVWDNPAGSTVSLRDYASTFVEMLRIMAKKLSGEYGKRVVKDAEGGVMPTPIARV